MWLWDLIHCNQYNIDKLSEGTEREGFEPSVNKSLHSSSNATP